MARVHRLILDPVTGQELLIVDGVPGAATAATQGSFALRRDAATGATLYVRLASSWELVTGGGGGITGLTAGAIPYATGASSLVDSIATIVSARLHVAGEVRTTGSAAGWTFYDRSTGVANAWQWYVTSDTARLFSLSAGADKVTVTTGGVVTATSFAAGIYRGASGGALLSAGATYTDVCDPSATAVLTLGNATDPGNYHNNTTHYFRNRAAGTVFVQITGSALTSNVPLAVNTGAVGTMLTKASFLASGSSVGLYIASDGVASTTGKVQLSASGDTNKIFELLTGNAVVFQMLPGRDPAARLYGTNGRLALQGDSDGAQGIWFSNDESTWYVGRNGASMRLVYSGTDKLTVTSSLLTSASNITAPDFVLSSDSRLKTNVVPLTNALDRLLRIRGVSYQRHMQPHHEVGVLAQEVREVLPEAVHSGDDGYLGVAYERLIPLLIEAVRMQQHQIQSLQRSLEQHGH